MTKMQVGDLVLTRVLYADALIDPEPTGLTVDDVRSVPWREPLWAEGDQVRAAACAWVVRSGGRTIVIDPAGNIDDILHDPGSTRQHMNAFRAAFEHAGVDVAAVDAVVLSHIESVGIAAARDDAGDWRPFFPNSRILVSDTSRATFDQESTSAIVFDAFSALVEQQLLATYADGEELLAGVRAEWTGAHNPGHSAFHVGAVDEPAVTFVGHLAVTPLHLATGPCPAQHPDPERAWEWLVSAAKTGRWLTGPLWPTPGALRWNGTTFEPYGESVGQ